MRLLASFSFRLALLYALLFTLSLSILLGLFFWMSIARPTGEVERGLLAETTRYRALHAEAGTPALAAALDRRAATMAPRRAYHALIGRDGRPVTANLPSWPPGRDGGWYRIEADIYRDGDEDDHEALVHDMALPDGSRLLIGRDVEDLDELEEAVRAAAVWLLPALLLLVVAGSALMSRAIGRRIDAMSATARRVMDGELAERVPERGGSDDFARLAGTLNAMLDRIEASLDAVRRVSDGVAHELRTPLSRLQADLTELRSAPPERAADLVDHAATEAERLARMFDTVLRISRIEARRHQPDMRPVDLSALLDDAADYHAPQAEERGLSLRADIAPGLVIEADRDLIFQAVSNLLDNALKFTPEGGSVTLAAANPDGHVEITLADTGPGMTAAEIARAGERFFRAPEAAGIPGFGLGLALVDAVAALHGSRLTFDGRDGLSVRWRFPPSP